MAKGVLMPKAGISVESCIITEWLKKPGDQVAVGEILFSYETDKASFECESTEAGELLEIFYQDGDEVPVLVNVCAVGKAGEDVSALRPAGEEQSQAAPVTVQAEPVAAEAAPAAIPATAAPAAATTVGEVKISPRARRLAAQQKVDITLAAASGPHGRVIERDIRTMLAQGVGLLTGAAYTTGSGALAGTGIGGRVTVADLAAGAAAPAQAAAEYEDIAFTGMRRAISKSMTLSLASIPQLTHTFTFDATEPQSYRAKLKAGAEALGLPNITYNDMILFAVSRLLPKYPALNAHMLDGTTIRQFREVNLGMAVDTPRGLLVPVIHNAGRKSLAAIAAEAKALAQKAQDGTIGPDEMAGGTFTVTNLGAFGVESFTPVINPPQTGILGVNNIQQRVREKDGGMELYPAMGLSLTYDHRAIDGAPASRFAGELCRMLEQITLLLAE